MSLARFGAASGDPTWCRRWSQSARRLHAVNEAQERRIGSLRREAPHAVICLLARIGVYYKRPNVWPRGKDLNGDLVEARTVVGLAPKTHVLTPGRILLEAICRRDGGEARERRPAMILQDDISC